MKSKRLICALTAAVLCAGLGLVSCGKEETGGGNSADVSQTAAGEGKIADITEAVTGLEKPKTAEGGEGKKAKDGKDDKEAEKDKKETEAAETQKPAETTAAPETAASTDTQPTETTVTETSAETSAVTTTVENKGGDAAWSEALSEAYQNAANTQAEFLKTSAEGILTLHDITGDPVPDGNYKKGDGSVIAEELDKYAENDDYTIVIKDGKTVSVSIVTTGDDGAKIEETITE
ncbi:MAG: hypothetical protein K6B74_07590 [Ruminococcus sp.]|nr:hypothetical protein [Ruminococcus sp.]